MKELLDLTCSEKKQQKIIFAALDVFSNFGFQGSNLEEIAENAHISKSNLFYYFENKESLYIAVLSHVLKEWLAPLNFFTNESDPKQVLKNYIQLKYEMSVNNPQASRLYALEIIQGAPFLHDVLVKELKPLLKIKTKIIAQWIKQGKIKPISPFHLLLHIWAITQHYADFSTQIYLISGKTLDDKTFKKNALETTQQLLIDSLIIDT